MYEDPSSPASPARPSQGQRCSACGQLEADPWARFCGVCGGALVPAGAPAGGRPASSAGSPGQYGPSGGQYPAPSHGPAPAPVAPYAQGQPDLAQPVMYTIPSVGYSGPARIGAAISAAFMLIPCVLFGFLGAWLLHASRNLLDSWRNATIPVPIPLMSVNLSMNFIDLLSLHKIHDSLVYWDDRLWLTFAILWLVPWVLWIVAGVCFAVLVAAIYNVVGKLGGGMRVALRPTAAPARAPMASGGPPQAGGWQNPGWPQEPRR